jgi:hypothetical protein
MSDLWDESLGDLGDGPDDEPCAEYGAEHEVPFVFVFLLYLLSPHHCCILRDNCHLRYYPLLKPVHHLAINLANSSIGFMSILRRGGGGGGGEGWVGAGNRYSLYNTPHLARA